MARRKASCPSWRCDHGWDVDLDDGSSHYLIYNNLLLHGGLKLREGFWRKATNNIIIGNSLHPHVWYADSGDWFVRNIVMTAYRPALMKVPKWGACVDYNLFTAKEQDRRKFAAQAREDPADRPAAATVTAVRS